MPESWMRRMLTYWTWTQALDAYSYPVMLNTYDRAQEFPGWFDLTIAGDRDSTIVFENRYQQSAPDNIEAFFEVVYWKYYSQANRRQGGTNRIVDSMLKRGVTSTGLWNAVQRFIRAQRRPTLKGIRDLLGITTNVLAVALTLPALASPKTIPIVDNNVARWVNRHGRDHNVNRHCKLTPFRMNYTSLQDNDFPNYLNWVAWCREVASVLTEGTGQEWRARDVEMAVFTAQRGGFELSVLP